MTTSSQPPSPPDSPPPPPPDDDRRFVNNPFARALHPGGRRRVGHLIALTMVSLFGAVIMGAAFLLPLLFARGLLAGGAHGRWGMLAAGLLVAAIYLLVLLRLLRRRR